MGRPRIGHFLLPSGQLFALADVTLSHPCVPSPSSPLLTLLSASSAFAAVDHEAAFKADIAPILEKSCANCHDPKKAKNGKVKSGFDSSSLKSIVKGGK